MKKARLTLDGREIEAKAGATILEAARSADVYIPALCSHPDLPSAPGSLPNATAVYRGKQRFENANGGRYEGCGLCLVEIEGQPEPVWSCNTPVAEGLAVRTDSEALRKARQESLKVILADHPHACVLCPLREGCDLKNCSMGVPPEERCCDIFNHCEIRFVSEYVGIPPDTPKYVHKGRPIIKDEPLFTFDWNLCIGCTRCVRVCRDVRGIEALGFVTDEDGQIRVGTKGPTLAESGCIFCGACVVVCPSGAIMDKEGKKAQDALGFVPCVDACPAGIDIPRYVRFIAEGKYREALATVREKVPFPGVLGYVCYHPCERACRRDAINEPVSICRLKRFAFERGEDGSWKRFAKQKPDTGKRIAVVGSGPAGLTAAYYLSKQGHAVTVFEALPQPGGMLRYGIPPFRLPREVLDREIREIEAVGVSIRTGCKVESIEKLFEQGYDAVFLAIGAHRERRLNIPGEELAIPGVEFLRKANSGQPIPIGRRVAVIGGGNVATDVARTALRLGAEEVSILYRRTRAEMPAYPEEIERALEEGVKLQELVVPVKLERINDHMKLTCAHTELVQEGEGRPKPVLVQNSEFELEFDAVITAIGQEPEVPPRFEIPLGDGSVIRVDKETLQTDRPGVFAGGDAVTGPASVIEAIALGRRAAQAIDRFLGGDGDIEERLVPEEPRPQSQTLEEFLKRPRAEPICLALEQRLLGLDQVVDQGFSEEQARYESLRCLRCDIRIKLRRVPLPPRREMLKPLTPEAVARVPEVEGVYRLYDESREIVAIKGVPNLQEGLREALSNPSGKFFDYEEDPMYTQRESELLQQYLQQHGKLPGAGMDELEDLF